MMINPKQGEPIGTRPTEVDEDWFIRIQRAKNAREQGRKAREGRPPVNPIPRMPLSLHISPPERRLPRSHAHSRPARLQEPDR